MSIVRIQVDLDSTDVEKMESLMEKSRIPTRKEYVSSAIALLNWVITERSKGMTFAAVDESGRRYKEVVMPILERVDPSYSGGAGRVPS